MEQSKVDRINELARKSKTAEGLTDAEKQEQKLLRQEYVRSVLGNLEDQLQNTVIVDGQGNRRKLQKKEN